MSAKQDTRVYMVCEIGETTFRWRGGAYIDVGTQQDMGAQGIDGDDFHAYDVINVWDYALGASRIPVTLEAFEAACVEYMSEQDEEL